VNASGVWSDRVRGLDEGGDPDSIRPAKGVHLTVPWTKVRNDIAVVIPVPKDKRSLFVVPWGPKGDGTFSHSYVGTTDTDYAGPLDDPHCTADDIAYVLRALNASVDPAISGGITEADVTGVWAGLRPLVKSAGSGRTADLSRRHSITRNPNGVITVTGGKLTTYREMAEDTVDEVLAVLGRKARCRTRRLGFLGATSPSRRATATGVEAQLGARHGSFASELLRLAESDHTLLDPLVAGLEYRRVEAVWAVRCEMARTLDDVLTRRTRARLLDRAATVAAAADVARLIAPLLNWDEAETQRQVRTFVAACADEAAAGQVDEAEYIASLSPSGATGGTAS
jgi:glycerol-3-phosphate dehydrogenase